MRCHQAIVAAGVVLACVAAAAQAAVIVPADATGTSPSYGSPANLVNSAGLLGNTPVLGREHQTTHTQGWLINNTNPANSLVFQMPGPRDVSGA